MSPLGAVNVQRREMSTFASPPPSLRFFPFFFFFWRYSALELPLSVTTTVLFHSAVHLRNVSERQSSRLQASRGCLVIQTRCEETWEDAVGVLETFFLFVFKPWNLKPRVFSWQRRRGLETPECSCFTLKFTLLCSLPPPELHCLISWVSSQGLLFRHMMSWATQSCTHNMMEAGSIVYFFKKILSLPLLY